MLRINYATTELDKSPSKVLPPRKQHQAVQELFTIPHSVAPFKTEFKIKSTAN